jgi:hypothetical protein
MAGYRVGAMYRTLHDDLMQIAPPRSRTERQKQVFYAFMHIRYRILLEKGLREIEQTISLGERTSDSSAWIQRAKEARGQMRDSLESEKQEIARMPFGEEEVRKALDILAQKSAGTH